MTTYRTLGSTDDVIDCQICYREELTHTVMLEDEDGEIVYAGRVCAAKLAGQPVRQIDQAVRQGNRQRAEEERRRAYLQHAEETAKTVEAVAVWVETQKSITIPRGKVSDMQDAIGAALGTSYFRALCASGNA